MSQRSISQHWPRYKNVFATLSLTAAVAFASNTAVAQQPEHAHQTDHTAAHSQNVAATNAAAQRKAAIDSTESFINADKQWAQARGASNKAAALENLIAKAEARYEMMAELIKTNPAEALRVAIPEEKQVGMPAEVLEMLEQRVQLDGEVEAFSQDFEDGTYKFHQFLKTPFGERFELHGAAKHESIQSGTQVSINGLLLEDISGTSGTEGYLALSEEESSVEYLAAGGDGTSSSSSTAASGPSTFGEQRTLVVMANFQDNLVQPWTKADAQQVVFGTVNDFYKENSSQQTWLTGDVVGWITAPLDSSECDGPVSTLVDGFYDATVANGIDPLAYSRVIYIFPNNSSCRWGGLGGSGGTPTLALVNGLNPAVIAHELGHNMELKHAKALECGNSTLGSSCSAIEYGDVTDVMGKTFVHFNAYNKEKLGWLDTTPVSSSGVYSLGTYADPNSSAPKALKILQSQDPVSGHKNYYYLSLRQGYGIDSYLAGSDNLQQGITIQSGGSSMVDPSYLLDMTPESGTTNTDFYDPALTAGNSFNDFDAGINIETLSVEPGLAEVYIDVAQQSTCTQTNPAISLSPSTQWATAGTSVTYNVTITNKDSANCGNSTYSLSANTAAGWGSSFNTSSVALAPGASASATLTVSSPSSAVNGFYNTVVTAASGSYAGTATATYVVDTPTSSNSAPVAVNDSVTITSKTAVSISVMNNDWDPENDVLKVSSITHGAKGKVKINSNSTVTYTPSRSFKSSDSFTYTIWDGAKYDTAVVSVKLESSSDSTDNTGGGKGNGKKR